MLDFKQFKEQRKSMAQSLSKLNESKSNKESDIFFPTADENGNSYAIIRLLPQKDVNKHPIQIIYKHKYNKDGKMISLLCPSTFGTMKDCPLCQQAYTEYMQRKNSGEMKPEVASYRKSTSIANVLVIKDANNPQVNGKVMRMYIPFQLQQKIDNKLFPPTDKNGVSLREPEMIHDLWEGRNIIISVFKNKFGYNDYSNCEFASEKTPVAPTEKEIEDIYNQIKDLLPDKTKCENPDTIIEKWNNLMGLKNIKLEEPSSNSTKGSNLELKNEVSSIEKKLENEFSMESTKPTLETSSDDLKSSSDEEELPWD